MCRADMALRTRRVDPGDVERWRIFKASLQETIKVWFRSIPVDGEQTNSFRLINEMAVYSMMTIHVPSFVYLPFHIAVVIYLTQGADLGTTASSLLPAFNMLKAWLQRIHESASVEYLNVDLTPITQAELGLAQNNMKCLTFFRRCMEFGEMVATSPADLINHLAFSRIKASNGLLEGAMALGTEARDVSVENYPPSKGPCSVQVDV